MRRRVPLSRAFPAAVVSGRRTVSATVPPSVLGIGFGLLLYAASVFAHHGTSEYVMTEEIRLSGTVTAWTFRNPHTWLRLNVSGPAGATTEWSIESAPPGYMAAQGWSAASLQSGEEVTVLISPLRDEAEPNRGILLEVDPAGGEKLIVRPRGRFGRPATLE